MKSAKTKSKTPKSRAEASPATKELKKLSLHINEFGAVVRDVKTEEINAFLNENVPDKKME